jgi:glycerol uptake facilitator-like aquaporin
VKPGVVPENHTNFARRIASEFVSTAFLLAAIVGSGIMGERLAGGNTAIALIANTVATGAALVALIFTFGPISGAHMNPIVTLTEVFQVRRVENGFSWGLAAGYISAQFTGAVAGVAAANIMFGEPVLLASRHVRSGGSQIFSEFIATFGLLGVIHCCARFKPVIVPFAVGAYITSAYWFTSSTSFANPAVTVARSLTDTFAGIRPTDAPGFIAAQFAGAAVSLFFFNWLTSSTPSHHTASHQTKEKSIYETSPDTLHGQFRA